MGKILERDKLKNRTESGKRSIFQGFLGKFPQFAPEWSEHFPFHHSDSKYPFLV